ncbi:MAG: uracil-DNA glycosylase [Bacteroidota bacterium]
MEKVNPQIHDSWKNALSDEFQKSYFLDLKKFLLDDKKKYRIYPPGPSVFNAFNQTPFTNVKVVIIGQDPYHGTGQAHGLCFSVPFGIKPPPSLINIFKEIRDDLGLPIPNHGNLDYWAMQGVLLLNATLTVRANQPGSHQGKGWEEFTNTVILKLSETKENLVFLLWGKYAQNKEELIDTNRHHILKAPHPSPFSANSGFFGCKHFSKTNDILVKNGVEPIDWRVPDVL